MLPTRDFNFKDTHRRRVKGEKKKFYKWKPKASWDSYTYIRQNRL